MRNKQPEAALLIAVKGIVFTLRICCKNKDVIQP